MQKKGAFIVYNSMAGVIASRVTDYRINAASKVINDLSLTFITPLPTNYGISRHLSPCYLSTKQIQSGPRTDQGAVYQNPQFFGTKNYRSRSSLLGIWPFPQVELYLKSVSCGL